MKHLNFPVDPKLHRRLRLAAVHLDRPMAKIIREAIKAHLDKLEKSEAVKAS